MQMWEYPANGVGDRRVDRAARLVARAEHEVVDEQLRSSVEQLGERLLAVVGIEAVLLLHPHPWQLASLPRELIAEPGVLLLAYQQPLASGQPFLACSDVVVSHFLSFESFASYRCLSVAPLVERRRLCAPFEVEIRDRAENHRSDRDTASAA
jgi:hypothetical protein